MYRLIISTFSIFVLSSAAWAGVAPTTYDPASVTGGLQLSDGNLRTTVNGIEMASSGGVRSVHSVTSGKYYWEVKLLCPAGANVTDTLGFSAGVIAPNVAPLAWVEYFHSQFADSVWGLLTDGPDAHHADTFRRLFANAGNMVDQDIIRLALDMDNGLIWLGRNDQWADGDPATGMNPTFSGLPGELYAAIMAGSRQCSVPPDYLTAVTNFGPTFDYPVPDGFNAGFGPIVPDVLNVGVDIKPGSDPNCFNANGRGVIPVAVLGSESFDVANIDQATLSFGGADVRVRGNRGPLCSLEDVNSDGFNDLVCHFEDNSDYWEPGQDDATLTGVMLDGTRIEGTDSICIVP